MEKKKGDGVTLALCMRRRLYPYERTRCRRAKLRTDSGYAGGLLLNEPPYWYRIPSTFCDPSTLDARPATFMDIADNIRRAPLAALRDLSVFLSYLPIISPASLLLLLLLLLCVFSNLLREERRLLPATRLARKHEVTPSF